VQSEPVRRGESEGGTLAGPSARLKNPVITATKSWAAISLTAGLRAQDFSPIPLIAFLVFVLSRPYLGIVQDAYLYIWAARSPISIRTALAAI
jgi:hypothetical protein